MSRMGVSLCLSNGVVDDIVYIQTMGLAFYRPQKDLSWAENQWFQMMSQNLSK